MITKITHKPDEDDPTEGLNSIYTTSGASYTFGHAVLPTVASVRIDSNGIDITQDADITIKGRKLSKILEGIEARLALLHPNIKLESEFRELQDLGNRYRELEQRLQSQLKVWDVLKNE